MDTILTPVLLLAALTVLMAFSMGMVRLPAMRRMGLTAQDARHTQDLHMLPSRVRQLSDNYRHLVEQPTAFYAVVFYIHLAGHTDPLHIQLAWAYVALRFIHTIVQSTINVVMVRFWIYFFSTVVLAVMVGREIVTLLG